MSFKFKPPKILSWHSSRSNLKARGSDDSTSEFESAPVNSIVVNEVTTSTSNDPSPHCSLAQDPDSDSQLSNRSSSSNQSEPPLSNVAKIPGSVALIQCTTNDTAIAASHSPQDRLLSYPLPWAPTQATNRLSILSGAHDFGMRDLVHAPNATHVHIVNEGMGPSHLFNIEWGRLDALPKHPEMSSKLAEYLPDSRKSEVEELCQRESHGTDLVMCIHGPAGIGKSTLAGHLSDRFRAAGRLAASIFLSAFRTDTTSPEAIIKMAAREIGMLHRRAIPKIVEAMDQCHGASLETHLQKYIIEPLRSLEQPNPLIIIIDAMDEWLDHPLFIKALASLHSQSRIVKFILTDRLNPCASHLPGIDSISIYTYALGPIRKEVIKAFFQKHLDTVPWVDGRMAHLADIEKLTDLSGGLPVWAATVIALLSHHFSDSPPHVILEEIIGSRRQVGDSERLAELYSKVLARPFPLPEDRKWLRRYLGATVVLQEPLSLSDFEVLSGIRRHLIERIQFSLSALQTRYPPTGSETMVHPASAVFHLSFLEYVQAKTTESSFSVSAFDSHSTLGLACIKQLLSLPSSASHPRGHQWYVVKYWLIHVSKGTPRPKDEWIQTEHCRIFQRITAEVRRKWAKLFIEGAMPGYGVVWTADQEDDVVSALFGDMASFLRLLFNDMVSLLMSMVDQMAEGGGSGQECWGLQVACLEVAVRIDDSDDEVWMRLGELYREGGDRTGSLLKYEEALVASRRALDLRSDLLHPGRADALNAVATALKDCYGQNGNTELLNEAASLYREGLNLRLAPHPDRPRWLNNLANTLLIIYKCGGGIETLKEAKSLYREALALCPAPHPDHPLSLGNLANALVYLHEHDGGIETLNEAISFLRKALALCPSPHPLRPSCLNNLASALLSLCKHDVDVRSLHEASSLYREALVLFPAVHPKRSLSLNNLANALLSLYKRDGEIRTLNEAISLYRESLGLLPAPHPDRPISLNNLANALLSLYKCDKNIRTLNEGISFYREALALYPTLHLRRPTPLNNLSLALLSVYAREGGVGALVEVVSLRRERLALSPAPHPEHLSSLNSLADALKSLYSRNGSIGTLNEASSLYREVLTLYPTTHPSRSMCLNSLADVLSSRYKLDGSVGTLNEAILLYCEALALRPAPHPERHSSLNNLAHALISLYNCDDDLATLNEAISRWWEALALLPAPHFDRPATINNLAVALKTLYDRDDKIETLTKAIALHHEALSLCPASHPDRPGCLNNLANALLSLCRRKYCSKTFGEAILLYYEAITLCPAPHPYHRISLDNLTCALRSFCKHDCGTEAFRKEAISIFRAAIAFRPGPDPNRPRPLPAARIEHYSTSRELIGVFHQK